MPVDGGDATSLRSPRGHGGVVSSKPVGTLEIDEPAPAGVLLAAGLVIGSAPSRRFRR
ncbi:hypothetical protein [Halalkalicoccus ordinarius]|uniref:hypothetical protein n=1 Tax=Halalkalicoccus ordinarius TaxID=3116651 RepID=UPI00300F3D5E